jgi:hypothetical protein
MLTKKMSGWNGSFLHHDQQQPSKPRAAAPYTPSLPHQHQQPL